MIRYPAFIIVLVLAAGCFAQEAAVPRFESAACAIEIPKGERAECGYLISRENRSTDSKRTIRLPIIILKSDSATPKSDPVLRTLGGPGASSLKLVRGRRSSPWLRDRDYIIFEQRGTKYADPALDCPEVDAATAANVRTRADRKTARKNEVESARTCYERLTRSGIDLSAYNSAESAADIEDLRKVLKLEKINLYAVSYSARLMLTVMRMFPSGIRSVVLESVLPIEANYDEIGVDGVVRSFNQMFHSCVVDVECAKAYPDLENRFYEVVRGLNAKPLSVKIKDEKTGEDMTVDLNGDDFVTWIADYFFSNEPSATVQVPLLITVATKGDFRTFEKYAGEKLNPSSFSLGMRYSVWCSEELPFEKRSIIDSQSTKYPNLKGYEVMSLPDICSVWKVKAARGIENKPIKSDIPTLIFAALYDAYTPPEWGLTTSRNLKNSFYFAIPWAGHGPGFSVPCVSNMIASFLDDPTTRPSDECVQMTKSQFRFLVKKT